MKVRVYRNLKHGRKAPPLYSVVDVSTGKVIARQHRVLLSNCKFVVREAGRKKCLTTGVKNVHAFVVGELLQGNYGSYLTVGVKYTPQLGRFVTALAEVPLTSAGMVLLNEHGMSASEVKA